MLCHSKKKNYRTFDKGPDDHKRENRSHLRSNYTYEHGIKRKHQINLKTYSIK